MSRLRAALAVVLLASGVPAVHSSTIFNLYTLGGEPAGEVYRGDTIDLLVRYVTTDNIGSVFFTIRLPEEGWTLASYNLSDYGWYQEDGLWDASVPAVSDTPVDIMNDTYAGNPSYADFMISTVYDPLGTERTGTQDVMRFTLGIPGSTVPGLYSIGIYDLDVTDGWGDPLSNVSAGDDFELTVVPEAGTLAMVMMGLGLLGGLWRRRSRCAQVQTGE